MKNYVKVVGALACVLLMTSCASKNFIYLNDMEPGMGYPFSSDYEAVVHCGDRLNITVSSKSPELAVPFNANGGVFQVDRSGNVSDSGSAQAGYRVDNNGNIQFPILGELYVEGLKVSEVTDLIRNKIIEGKYIKEPLVTMEFLNFKYSVLGAVTSNGTFSVTGDRITLLEAIAKAGDVTPNGRLDRVCVIREEGGERKIYRHDLRSKTLFDSPCFYLQQNDIIYVEPKKRKRSGEDTFFKYLSLFLSIVTATTSVIWVTTLKK